MRPIDWIPGSGERNDNVNAIITELVRQAREGGFSAYRQRAVNTAIRAMADVGDDATLDSYRRDIARSDAVRVVTGRYHITDEGFERFEEERDA